MTRRRAGISLVEVLIALVILAIALLAMAGTSIMTTKLLSHTIEREDATFLAVSKLEELESLDLDTLADNSDSVGGFTRQWVVSGDATGVRVTVTVTWNGVSGNGQLSVQRDLSPFAHWTALE